jgi:Ca2+-binding RTX toxin-like protein
VAIGTQTPTSERADLLAGPGEQWATGNIANAIVIAGVNNNASNPDAGYIENAIGGSGDDVLIGNIKANVLTGGAGGDMLTGAGGNDKFVFDSLIGLDTITDFISGQDKLEFVSFTFTSLTPVGGPLDIGEFASTLAADADDFIIYNAATGALSYDNDGSGSGSAIQVAVLGTGSHPSLNYSDILIA